MKPLLYVALLLFTACATVPGAYHRGAVRPALYQPPAYTPGFAPETPPTPVHTPAGAGASHGGLAQPGHVHERSENWTPAGGHAELRAMDKLRASVTTMPGVLFGLMLPPLKGLPEGEAKRLAKQCVALALRDLTRLEVFHHGILNRLGPTDAAGLQRRKCLAAHLYENCFRLAQDGSFNPPLDAMEVPVKARNFTGDPYGLKTDGKHNDPAAGWDHGEAEMELEMLVIAQCGGDPRMGREGLMDPDGSVIVRDGEHGRAILEIAIEMLNLGLAHND